MTTQSSFYRWFAEKKLTPFGAARRTRTERARLALVTQAVTPPAHLLELGPGQGTLATLAVAAGWRYAGIEPSPTLAAHLRFQGLRVIRAWTPPIPVRAATQDVVYADQVLEHMPGVEAARDLASEAWRVLRPGGVFFVVVPDYLKERAFFWDVDYTHNFVTTERRVRQLLYDAGFEIQRVVRSIGAATGPLRDLLAAAALLANIPGIDAVSRYTGTQELLFRIRKNLFETLAVVARKRAAS